MRPAVEGESSIFEVLGSRRRLNGIIISCREKETSLIAIGLDNLPPFQTQLYIVSSIFCT